MKKRKKEKGEEDTFRNSFYWFLLGSSHFPESNSPNIQIKIVELEKKKDKNFLKPKQTKIKNKQTNKKEL